MLKTNSTNNLLRFKTAFIVAIVTAINLPLINVLSLAAENDEIAPSNSNTVYYAENQTTNVAITDLLETINDITEIATKTKMNADFVPGIVTVLYGDDLEARGSRTVWEALSLVPGVETSIDMNGGMQIFVRGGGVGRTSVSGNIKLLVNGICLNAHHQGRFHPALMLPVEQVDRIEIIRGPGSAIYGGFAYMGVVNIVTRKASSRVTGRLEEDHTYSAAGIASWTDKQNELKLSLNAGWMESDGGDVTSGPDKLYSMGIEDLSNAPGPINDKQENKSGFLVMDYKDFSLKIQYIEGGYGDHFGVTGALPPDDMKIVWLEKTGMVDVSQRIQPLPSLDVEINGGWMDYKWGEKYFFLYPPGFMGIYPDGMTGMPLYEESKLYGGINMKFNGWERHHVLVSLSFAEIEIEEAWQLTNYVPSTLMPLDEMQLFRGENNWIREGKDRTVRSILAQDEFKILPSLTLTGGLRYDDYSDVGDHVSPRLAGVWQPAERHILKFQYGEAFRPPSFKELYAMNNPVGNGNENIDPATSKTYEIGYIYRKEKTVFRTTLFHTDYDDLVVLSNTFYENAGDVHLNGVELELEQNISYAFKLKGNISYVDTEDRDTDEQLEGAVNWLSNIGLIYQPRSDFTLYTQFRYVGDRQRNPTDERRDLGNYQTVDITCSFTNILFGGLNCRIGIKNLFDKDIKHPSPVNTYPDDYPRPGRKWWIQLFYKF